MRWLTGDFFAVAPRLLKYEVLTKTLMLLVILPIYLVATFFLVSAEGAVTNATIASFLTTRRGMILAGITLVLLLIGFAVELTGYVALTARARADQPEASYGALVRYGFTRLKNLIGIGGIALIVYLVVVVPLTRVGVNVSFLSDLKLPRFITETIWTTPVYAIAYVGAMSLLVALSILLVYTVHLVVLTDMRAGRAMRTSIRLVLGQPRPLIVGVVVKLGIVLLALAVLAGGWWYGIYTLLQNVGVETFWTRVLFAALVSIQNAVIFGIFFIQMPYYVNLVTHAFYRAIEHDDELAEYATAYPEVRTKFRRTWLDRILAHPWRITGLVVLGIGLVSLFVGWQFDSIYRPSRTIEVVAHRAGGAHYPENSIAGLDYAADVGAQWVEIDVQRTKDGHYVLNHDDTFTRVAGEKRAVSELTLEEVRGLDIGGDHGTERVPTLREFLESANGRMKVIIELKGDTADEEMADDVVGLVDELGMFDQTMLMSLDYDLITYIAENYPEAYTGFVYFLSIGDVTRLHGDAIVLEEGEATGWRLLTLSLADKDAMVWTVNKEREMRRLITRDLDAIITDEPELLLEVLRQAREASKDYLFFRMFLDVGL
ncbi:MAG: glycerophosphoryl diester phosphodiesterase membrane domain-containing protein [Bowdeniella nasicola]|nr:glycerophosphoryl diester phosphodiesterase membrane domain-containing protein [Bowdeniella nasicola]